MLQPLQLKDVAVRYAQEIAELREFLAKAGLRLDAAGTLHELATRLREDRAFRRDMTSHVWVVVHGGERNVSVSDLLGMVAVAAAGEPFAAAAGDVEAHEVLRFLMQARSSFGMAAVEPRASVAKAILTPEVAAAPVVIAVPVPGRVEPEVTRTVTPMRRVLVEEAEAVGARRPSVWAYAVAAVVMVMVALWWHHSTPAKPAEVAVLGTSEGAESSAGGGAAGSAPGSSAAGARSSSGHTPPNGAKAAPRSPGGGAGRNSVPRGAGGTVVPWATSEGGEAAGAPAARSLGRPLGRPSAGGYAKDGSVATAATAKGHAINSPRRRLVYRPSMPTAPERSGGKGDVPEVTAVSLGTGTGSVSDPVSEPGSNSGINSGSNSGSGAAGGDAGGRGAVGRQAGGRQAGGREAFVRPTSLGLMAGNVTYSPAPAYPKQASAAHVQGEVKLEAEVDRYGNVSSTRIISGPPLLRDAAADALQSWRYRPYLYHGKPMAMSAMVVMDFHLP